MMYFINGILHSLHESSIIVETSGVGYEIFCTIPDISSLVEKVGQPVFIYTHLIHKEDSMTLYGFLRERTKKGFLGLMKVSGIGPKQAVKILSHYNAEELFEYVHNEDIDSLVSIPGIGPKMAKKIIFDLKGVIPAFEENEDTSVEKDLISAMANLGYKEAEIRNALSLIKPIENNFEKEFKRLLKQLAGK